MADPRFSAPLPIDAVLDDVRGGLRAHGDAVLVAAPGAATRTASP